MGSFGGMVIQGNDSISFVGSFAKYNRPPKNSCRPNLRSAAKNAKVLNIKK